jgi:hypothetical protein
MPTNPDNALHDAVRQALAGWQAAPQPGDWERLRARLRRRRWLWAAGLAGIALLLAGIWWVSTDVPRREAPGTLPRAGRVEGPRVPPVPSAGCTPGRAAVTTHYSRLSRKNKPIFPPGQPPVATSAKPSTPSLQPARPLPPGLLPVNVAVNRSLTPPSVVEQEIIQQVVSGDFGEDSTSFRALQRNLTRWRNAVLVCDATTSMHPYLTQLLLVLKKNERNAGVKGIVFYTDCDSLGRPTNGTAPGRFFVSRRRDVATLLPLLLATARNTTANDDRDENVAEALLFAQHEFPDAQTLVLVADGRSGAKDRAYLAQVTKPVAVVQCGPPDEPERAFQPDYWQLAARTHGSLHTLEDDLRNLDRIPENTWVRIGKQYYRFRRGRFVPTRFVQRPEKVLFFWAGRKE